MTREWRKMYALLTDVSAIRCTLAVRHRKKSWSSRARFPFAQLTRSFRCDADLPSRLPWSSLSSPAPVHVSSSTVCCTRHRNASRKMLRTSKQNGMTPASCSNDGQWHPFVQKRRSDPDQLGNHLKNSLRGYMPISLARFFRERRSNGPETESLSQVKTQSDFTAPGSNSARGRPYQFILSMAYQLTRVKSITVVSEDV